MSGFARRRRALLVTDDGAAAARVTEALATYGFDVESEPDGWRPDVVIIIGAAPVRSRVDFLASTGVPVVVALRDEQIGATVARLFRREHILLPFPIDPIEIVRAARRLTREIVTIW